MATAETVVPADPQHYVWWFPGCPVKVHLDFQVVQRVRQRLSGLAKGTSDEGLLFGRTRDGATEITDFQPAGDTAIATLVSALTAERQRTLVGYYRTEEGDSFHLTPKDLSLVQECFTKPHQVLLTIHSNGFGAPNATFFFHDRERRMADLVLLEFPFDSSLLAAEAHDRNQRSHEATAERSAVALAPAPVVAPVPRRRGRRRLLTIVGGTCAVALAFATGRYVYLRQSVAAKTAPAVFPAPAEPVTRPSIELHAARKNGDLELTWNRESPLIVAATSGVISIQDGSAQRQISLDAAQIHGGSLLYSPVTDQVLMQLTVTTLADTVTESVMVVLPTVGAVQTYLVPAPPEATPLEKASKPFVAPSPVKPLPAEAEALQEPPVVRISPPASTVATPNVPLRQPVAPPPTPPVQAPAVPTQPVKDDVLYEAPVAIQRVSPAYPADVRALVSRETIVEVAVTIDETGTVTGARAIPRNNVGSYLLKAAADAARLWRFQPARRNHEAVPSESRLRFVFRP